jgi:diguanylate cyclase (GGDEF)-like protein/PAS domain S-box-containing protein
MRSLLASPEERIFFKDRESRFLLVSAGWLATVGQGQRLEEVIGKTDLDIFSVPHAVAALEDEQRVLATGEPMAAKVECETYHGRPDAWVATVKQPLFDDDGKIIGTWGISRDVTAQIDAERALEHQVLHDPVTGLMNRVALIDRLEQALIALERRPGRVGLLFIDVDNFKAINDSLGHDAGDRLLVEIGRRLKQAARRVDTVARLGGDEFVILGPELTDDDDPRLIGERVLRAIRAPLKIDGKDVVVTASVGAVLTDDPHADPGELLQRADGAMYGAKRAGRNGFQISNANTTVAGEPITSGGGELRRAIDNAELFVVYQPLFRLDNSSVTGAEALVRWRHPQRGIVMPAEFMALAEEHGLIAEIDSFVLNEACRQLAEWRGGDDPWDDFVISVNVSGRGLSDPELLDRVVSTLERHAIAPSQLCLEITESALIGELGNVNQAMDALSGLGVHFALDDFGTGYSTLAHLQLLATDILKINRRFVGQFGEQSRDREIIAAITAMANALGMSVVGEGIETNGRIEKLLGLECEEGQRYAFARPVSPPDVAALRSANRPRSARPTAATTVAV